MQVPLHDSSRLIPLAMLLNMLLNLLKRPDVVWPIDAITLPESGLQPRLQTLDVSLLGVYDLHSIALCSSGEII